MAVFILFMFISCIIGTLITSLIIYFIYKLIIILKRPLIKPTHSLLLKIKKTKIVLGWKNLYQKTKASH